MKNRAGSGGVSRPAWRTAAVVLGQPGARQLWCWASLAHGSSGVGPAWRTETCRSYLIRNPYLNRNELFLRLLKRVDFPLVVTFKSKCLFFIRAL